MQKFRQLCLSTIANSRTRGAEFESVQSPSESGCQTMLATRCRNESEGFTLVQEGFIGYPEPLHKREKVQLVSYPGLVPAFGKLLFAKGQQRTYAVPELQTSVSVYGVS